MSDDKTKNDGDRDSKKALPKKKAPLKKPHVDVEVKPKSQSHADHSHARKVKQGLEKEVRKAIEEKKGGGADAQFEEADKKVDQAKDAVSPKKIEKIRVKVSGEDEDGDKVSRERIVKPKEK